MDAARRFAGPVVAFLVGAGLQLGGYQNDPLAVVLFIIAGAWALLAAVTWEPIARRLPGGQKLLGPDLKVTIEREEWDDFQHLARILEIRVRIRNRRRQTKRITGYGLQFDEGGYAGGLNDQDLLREVEHRKRNRPKLDSILESHEEVRGWMVYAVPWSGGPGTPTYTFRVYDELNNEYEAKKP
jgi:hypothetical protein